jgi:hypothetical protein
MNHNKVAAISHMAYIQFRSGLQKARQAKEFLRVWVHNAGEMMSPCRLLLSSERDFS